MGETTTVASLPKGEDGEEKRASVNFDIVGLPKRGNLLWRVITMMGDEDIYFDVRQQCAKGVDEVRFKKIKNGTITPYVPYRNLYVSDPQNATGHFIVRIEACE
ncbi:hypothetical protein CS063_15685 [Sporanaerobium hydrogeniformans]|uniref:Uncharacterized protein n=1 Tax=Sporanaerobium hydrogeniformans TaxID=3072179 RepID=A0AC61D759_9FIRM|nr:hypothetical protein [Sporanaerobium hydrogeniformans]PHV69439.1 hypothetical protein CS063_15685 [Sporanaerobium hydrogeniformans]